MAKSELEGIVSGMRTLDSKITLLDEKIKTIEKNEEVLGRTLVALNNRLKKIEEGGSSSRSSPFNAGDLEKKFATKQEVREMRYVIDSINPLEYATISQVRELLNEKLGDIKKTAATLVKQSKNESNGIFEKI